MEPEQVYGFVLCYNDAPEHGRFRVFDCIGGGFEELALDREELVDYLRERAEDIQDKANPKEIKNGLKDAPSGFHYLSVFDPLNKEEFQGILEDVIQELEEKLYKVTYEHEWEPGHSRTTRLSVGKDANDAITRLLGENPREDKHIVLGAQEFTLPGYKIHLERLLYTEE